MRPLYWKLALVTACGLGLGTFGGQATIAGMAPPVATADRADPPAGDNLHAARPGGDAGTDDALIADACDDCSDYDLGYRFAASRRLTTTADCMDYSWSYQRGCLAYLRKG